MKWWRRVLGRLLRPDLEQTPAKDGTPPPVYLLHPYTEPVTQEEYLAGWSEVRQLPAGKRVIAMLHQRLASVLSEKCPLTIHTPEERSIWLANHDGRLLILEMLAREAYLTTKLSGALPTQQKLKGPSA